MAREVKQINFPVLRQQVEDGWKREQIMEHWDLTEAATKRLLREAGLRLRPTRYPVYQIVGMENETTNSPEETQMAEEEFEEFQDEMIHTLEEESGESTEPVAEVSEETARPATEDVNW